MWINAGFLIYPGFFSDPILVHLSNLVPSSLSLFFSFSFSHPVWMHRWDYRTSKSTYTNRDSLCRFTPLFPHWPCFSTLAIVSTTHSSMYAMHVKHIWNIHILLISPHPSQLMNHEFLKLLPHKGLSSLLPPWFLLAAVTLAEAIVDLGPRLFWRVCCFSWSLILCPTAMLTCLEHLK